MMKLQVFSFLISAVATAQAASIKGAQEHRALSAQTCVNVPSVPLSAVAKKYYGSGSTETTGKSTTAYYGNHIECTLTCDTDGIATAAGVLTLQLFSYAGRSGTFTAGTTGVSESKSSAYTCSSTPMSFKPFSTTAASYALFDSYIEVDVTTKSTSGGVDKGTASLVCTCYYPDTPGDSPPADCFSREGSVDVEGKGPVSMEKLEVGDRVKTSSGSYEAVLGFTHKDLNAQREFLQFYLDEQEKPLEMTEKHLVYAEHSSTPVAAKSLKIGDKLQGVDGSYKIVDIQTVVREGLYAPLTPSGEIVVDGVKASNYVALQEGSAYAQFSNGMSVGISQHSGIHLFVSPFRLLCKSGFSSVCSSSSESGMPFWVEKGIRLARFAQEQNTFVQAMMLICVLAVFVPIYGFEVLFGGNLLCALVVSVSLVAARAAGVRPVLKKVKSA